MHKSLLDLEGKTDLKIRALEAVEELRTKRADKQVGQENFRDLLSFFSSNLKILLKY